jgi:fructose-1,6-bisphosphatase I
MSETSVVTLARHIVEEERRHPEATGAFSNILYDIALAAKIISRDVNKAGLIDILGRTGATNVHGESVQKLDMFAHDVIYKAMDHTGNLCCMASEEYPDVLPIPERFPTGEYVLLFDPLDGSSNIDVNVSIGTIFSVHRKISQGERGGIDDCLQPGSEQLAAGYVVYGSSTMLVYSSGAGVHGFTLDPGIGEFLLSHPSIRMPDPPSRTYSVNEAYYPRWSEGQKRLVDHLKGLDGSGGGGFSSRYIGSLVADFHRTLLQGGLFMYPADAATGAGKLRLLYEAAPLAYIVEQAGGRASDGAQNICALQPRALHQRVPFYIGSSEFVTLAETFLGGHQESVGSQISAERAGAALPS